MNSNELTTSTPKTIQNYDNYLKDYVNLSGYKWNTTCLELSLSQLDKYVQSVGDYNTVTATNPQYTPPSSYQVKDYSGPCPEGWWNQGGGNCINPYYNAKPWGQCAAGRWEYRKQSGSCPTNNWFKNYYSGWYGPTDSSQFDLSNTNVTGQNGTICTAGWSTNWSQTGAKYDCENNNGGTFVNYYNDPGFWYHGYTCLKPTEYKWENEGPSGFNGYSPDDQKYWENICQAYWPMKTISVPDKWTCQYGANINDDISRGNIFQIGTANSPANAAKMALQSNRLKDNYFFMIDSAVYIIGSNSDVSVITSKGAYQVNCTEQNNKKGTLYYISQGFFDLLNNCKVVNDKINQTNNNRNILQTAVIDSIKENFDNLSTTSEIIKNQDEIIRNLAKNYNQKAKLYNYQVDLIGQKDQLVERQNMKLNRQLDDLTAIQDQIALKDRVIELNDDLTKKQIRNKKIIIGFFVLLPFLGIPLLLVIIKAFTPTMGLSLAGLMIVGYIIYMLVVANQNDIKKFGREDKRIISKYEKAISNYWNKEKEALSKSLSRFVNGECVDNSSQQEAEETKKYTNNAYPKGDYLMKANGPFYYYDGSAPPQQVYPSPIGSIEFNIEGKNLKFPREISEKFEEIQNPITKFFFQYWGMM